MMEQQQCHVLLATLLVFAAAIASVVLVPFSKVEESFNLHAIHDIVYHGTNTSQYDHHEFPGVVPRTFIGSIVIGVPVKVISILLGNEGDGGFKFMTMLLGRGLLALVNCACVGVLLNAIQKSFSTAIMWYTALVCASQFHFIFYISRTLPNTFALPFVTLAFACWMSRKYYWMVVMFAIAVPVFRAELVALAGPILLFELLKGSFSFMKMLKWGLPMGLLAIGVSVVVDSLLWGYTLWPEGTVLYFNTVLNKSSQWGTEPFLWYFYSAIPRSLSVGVLFVPIGVVVSTRVRKYVLLVLAFVALYSLLPHKELRFILYSVPLLNLGVACGIDYLIKSRTKLLSLFGTMCLLGVVMGILCTTALSTSASAINYPGGEAMRWLHANCDPYCGDAENMRSVHISNLAAQSGASRFSQTNPFFEYSKVEKWTSHVSHHDFTWLIAEVKDADIYSDTHDLKHTVHSLSGISLSKEYPFIQITKAPSLIVMKKRVASETREK
eukprot:m.80201 g.80201  ORF g.80201 m.80201 type:complete len:496 (-) comp12007_c0_seq1:1467-2954(-)